MSKKKRYVVQVEDKSRGGCLKPVLIVLIILIGWAIFFPADRKESNSTTEKAKSTTEATATVKSTSAPRVTSTPSVPGTYKPGIEGTNAYDVTVAMKNSGIEEPKRQNCTDGYIWQSKTYIEDGVSYNIEIETDKKYRVTTMQIMMSGGNNNFVWWACACMFGEDSEQVAWLKEHMWDGETVTATFSDAIWTINPITKGVMLTVQHVDAEKWYMSLI